MTAARPKLPPLMTVGDFIDWPGDGLGTRFELVDGVVRAMTPASDAHNTIAGNLTGLIWQHLRQTRSPCRVAGAPGVQPRVRADWNFRIPDLGVTCAPNRAGDLFTPDPILIVEILSPGNTSETYESVRAYATLPSVLDILIVHSTRVKAELLRRDAAGAWPANPEVIDAGGTVHLSAIGFDFPLDAAYAGTHLESQ